MVCSTTSDWLSSIHLLKDISQFIVKPGTDLDMLATLRQELRQLEMEVIDAQLYLPAYDQKRYIQVILAIDRYINRNSCVCRKSRISQINWPVGKYSWNQRQSFNLNGQRPLLPPFKNQKINP
jgi:hypothetical protein